MRYYICETCGVQYEASAEVPKQCIICIDERQYVPEQGQLWTTLEKMRKDGEYRNTIIQEEPKLHSITTNPKFAIGQTAYIICGKNFNVMWDCVTYLDESTIKSIQALGGIQAIALSHPHYYSSQVEWAEVFGAPIYIHVDDRQWVTRQSNAIVYWSGESLELHDGVTLHRLGGHFAGGAVLHWEHGDDNKGVLLTGDIIQVVADRKWVSFMYSYPNLIPLPARKVEGIAATVKPLKFNRLYNAFKRVVKEEASSAVQKSAQRYIKALNGTWFTT